MPNQVRLGVGVTGAKQGSSEIDQLRDKFGLLQKQGAKGFAIGAGAAVTAKALSLVGAGIGDVTGFLNDSIHAYREQEVATVRLNASLKANVVGWNGSTGAIEEHTKSLMSLGFTDTEAANSLALLVAATHDVEEAFRVQAVAADLARFKGVSLTEASEALTKVEAGSYRILKSLGIQLRENATQTEALAAVEKVAGGQARAYAETDLGKLDAASAKTEQAQEKLGATMSKIGAAVLPVVSDAFSQVIDDVEEAGAQTGKVVGGLIVGGYQLGRFALGAHEAAAATRDLSHAERDQTAAQLAAVGASTEADREMAASSAEAADKIRAAQEQIGEGWKIAAAEFEGGKVIFRKTAEEIALEIAKGLLEHKGESADAMTELLEMMKHPLSGAKRIAYLEGRLTAKWLADGLASNDPYVRAKAEQVRQATEDELDALRRAAPGYGKRTAKAYADGLEAGVGYVQDAVNALLRPARVMMKASSPPGPESPLHEIDKWGERTGQAWAEGLAKGVGTAEDFGLGAIGTAIPGAPGAGGRAVATAAGGGSFNLHIHGVSVLTPGAAQELARHLEPIITRAQQGKRVLTAGTR